MEKRTINENSVAAPPNTIERVWRKARCGGMPGLFVPFVSPSRDFSRHNVFAGKRPFRRFPLQTSSLVCAHSFIDRFGGAKKTSCRECVQMHTRLKRHGRKTMPQEAEGMLCFRALHTLRSTCSHGALRLLRSPSPTPTLRTSVCVQG